MKDVLRDIHSKPIRRWVRSTLLWFVAASCCTVTVMTQWDGTKSSERTFEENLADLKAGTNPEASIAQLQRQMLEGVRELQRCMVGERATDLSLRALKRISEEAK